MARDEAGRLLGWSLRERGQWVEIGTTDEVLEPLPTQLPADRP